MRLHPIERRHLWPAHILDTPSRHVDAVRTQALLANLCAMVGSIGKKEGEAPASPWDYAPWLPRPKAKGEGEEGEGLTAIMAGGHMERLAREG